MNAKELLLLGIISRKATYGYELSNMFERMNIRNWANISMPYIYKLLNKLLEKGLVQKNIEETENRPPRDVYQITDKGWQALKSALNNDDFLEQKIYFDFDIVLAVYGLTGKKMNIQSLINQRITLLKNEIVKLTDIFQKTGGKEGKSIIAALIFEHQISYLEMEITWLKKVGEKI